MNFNGQSMLATEPNYEEFLDRLQPASQDLFREFRLAEIGAVDNSTGEVGLITADTPTDSLMVKWVDDTSRALFTSLGSNYTKYEAQIGEPLHVVYGSVRDSLEQSDETLKNVNDPDVTKFDVTVNFEDVTVEQWNSASATMDVGCREDGTGWYNVTGEGFLPHQTSTHFVVGAWTSQDEAIWINPFGGFPSLVSTNENGELSMYRDLQYCPLDLDDPVMFTFLLWHFGGSSWGIYPNGPEVLVGIHSAPNMCFTLGPKLVSPELEGGVFVSGMGLAK